MTLLLVILGAAVGAPARYLTDRFIQARFETAIFPWGTFTVNVVGSFVLGVVVASDATPWVTTLLGPGFCGALTTYSTFGFETVRLAEEGAYRQAAANVVGSIAAGLGAAFAGVALGSALA
jgi:CrcB protein